MSSLISTWAKMSSCVPKNHPLFPLWRLILILAAGLISIQLTAILFLACYSIILSLITIEDPSRYLYLILNCENWAIWALYVAAFTKVIAETYEKLKSDL